MFVYRRREKDSDDTVPLVINYQKFLLEEKKQAILDFAKAKLATIGEEGVKDSDQFLVFKIMVQFCDKNVNLHFRNSHKFDISTITMACEDNGLKFEEDKDDASLMKDLLTKLC